MQERSAVADSMLPSRNIGVVLSGTAFDRRSSWAGGVFNPWLEQNTSLNESPTALIGRGTFLPMVSADESSLIHLGLGLRYTNAKEALDYRSKPEFYSAPQFVDTGSFNADGGMLYDLEAAWRYGAFLLNGEYIINQVYSSALDDPQFAGFHVTASYILTGEMRPYLKRNGLFGPVPIAKPVTLGGKGAWEVSTRFSNVDLSDGTVDGGKMDIYSLGLNWWLSSAASLGIDYRHIILDQNGESGHSDGITTRITLLLE
jgi:phosphate-selective porin OprO/OprP